MRLLEWRPTPSRKGSLAGRNRDPTPRRTNTYDLTPDGQRVAIFYTKVHDRLLGPLIAADTPPAPTELRRALTTIDRHVAGYAGTARLGNTAQQLKTNAGVLATKDR